MKMIDRLKLTLILAISFVSSLAQSQIANGYEKNPPIFKQVIVETVYPLKIFSYKDNSFLNLKDKTYTARFDTPEAALESHFSAMKAGDIEAFLKTWSAADRARLRDRILSKNTSFEAVTAGWKLQFEGNVKLNLINYVEMGKYVLIRYQFNRAGSIEIDDTLALSLQGNSWQLTQDLSANPILTGWDSPTGRIRVPSQFMFDLKK